MGLGFYPTFLWLIIIDTLDYYTYNSYILLEYALILQWLSLLFFFLFPSILNFKDGYINIQYCYPPAHIIFISKLMRSYMLHLLTQLFKYFNKKF